MSGDFDSATVVRARGGDVALGPVFYDAEVRDGWDIFGNANGGYLMAIAARAMSDAADRPPLTVTAHYLSPGAVGPHTVEVGQVRAGRRLATMTGALVNVETGREVIRLLGSFGSADPDGPFQVEAEPPRLPPYDECLVDAEHGNPNAEMIPMLQRRLAMRLAPDSAGFRSGAPAGQSVVSGWFAFADDAVIDEFGLMLAADAFPPAVFNSGLPVGWVPTVEMTVHLRGLPAPGPLATVFRSRFISGGMLEEDGEVWDSAGNLVALSRQLALAPRPL